MEKLRVLYVTQEMVPFLPESEISSTARKLAQGMNEEGREIRAFMPRFGCINERRHQLHEVIRLSGLNLVINDTDHPLIIKVASVPQARIQVYFIDNEEFFKRKFALTDEKEKCFADNDERSIFFVRGVLETVKKLGWAPHIIHCHGWMSAFMPLYVKKMYGDDPHFAESKVVYSHYDTSFPGSLDAKLYDKLVLDGFDNKDIEILKNSTCENLTKLALQHTDAITHGSTINKEAAALISAVDKPVLQWTDEQALLKEHSEFYESIVEESLLV